jgi:hypothetical protein
VRSKWIARMGAVAVATAIALSAWAAIATQPRSALAAASRTPIVLGVYTAGAPGSPTALNAFAALIARRASLVMWYRGWNAPLIVPREINNVTSRGAAPMITWEPFDYRDPTQDPYPLNGIASGKFDRYIRASAKAAAAYRRPLLVRFAEEMNGNWVPWGAHVNGNTPALYIAAWRRIVRIFRADGATNVRWVWAPNIVPGGAPFAAYYPGSAWLDWVALDGYNWGRAHWPGWQSLAEVFGASYGRLTALSRKPVMIAETASTELGGDKARWILQGLLQELPSRLPRVRAVVWFNRDGDADWRVNSSPSALRAFRQVAKNPLYKGRLPASLR